MSIVEVGWGLASWGGASTPQALLAAFAVRENAVRLVFAMPVYFSTILDFYDASSPLKYTIEPVAGTADAIGEEPRAVSVIAVELPNDESIPPVVDEEVGHFVDVILDRPMSSYPARYSITCVQIKDASLTSLLATATYDYDAAYLEIQEPSLEIAAPIRDLANPQSGASTQELSALACYVVAGDGDYALDEGNTGRKKRVIRRLVTKPGGFAHLPTYGMGILRLAKKLARIDQVGKLASDSRLQAEREPDIDKAVVTADFGTVPNLLRLHVGLKPRAGRSQKFVVPLPIR